MSKNKSLSITQIEEVKGMVVSGVQPQKIADKYKVKDYNFLLLKEDKHLIILQDL